MPTVPVAFNAVVSIGVIGLYLCFGIPIYQRLKMGSRFQVGGWTLGRKYKVLCVVALLDILLVAIVAFLPTSNLGTPWYSGFSLKYVNYTILVVPVVMIALWVYWHLSVKHWFKGPKNTIAAPADQPAPSS